MNAKIENLTDLFIEQGRELYDATKLEQKELPNIGKHVSNSQLKTIVDRQVNTAKNQSISLTDAFKKLKEKPDGEKNLCCDAIIKQAKSLIDRSKDDRIRDAAIINSIQRLNHDKIASYGSLAAYAQEIGQDEIAKNMFTALEEEKAIDKDLSALAEREINRRAYSTTM